MAEVAGPDGPYRDGTSTSFACQTNGNPAPDITWYINGAAIGDDSNPLVVEHYRSDDGDTLRCEASNSVSSVTGSSITMPVESKFCFVRACCNYRVAVPKCNSNARSAN